LLLSGTESKPNKLVVDLALPDDNLILISFNKSSSSSSSLASL
jgi:hypothetical protein